jgi:septal ring factor EnvC (AmiA/AmiB activator)
MRYILASVKEDLIGIVAGVFTNIRDEFSFSSPTPVEEQIISKIKGQQRVINKQRLELSATNAALRDSEKESRDLEDLLEEKKKEIQEARKRAKDLESRLRRGFDSLKRRQK